MTKKNECVDFRCPEFVPANAPDDFCIPEDCCPRRKKQPKFPSPNSCLPLDELEELEARIALANNFLLDLALSEQREPNEIFQRAFDGLVGQKVSIEIDYPLEQNSEKNTIRTGRVFLVGFDFVVIRNRNDREVIIQFEKIKLIKLNKGRFAEPIDKPQLLDIEPCLRRGITFNFGEKVASSPELIQIFFRLRFTIYILVLVGKKVEIDIDGESMVGVISEFHEESLTINMKDNHREIPLNNICFITVLA
ncbi:hypothetical protein [Bacillus sp. JJ1562]|uniref:hypothetical protein n=1 Tax=Bacillus sp. JJ1562 TaxID=3122960 RepID=UPI00300184DA